jgi:tetratricopeptide (TPR) repeat protein
LPVAENFVRYDVVGPTLMINFRLMGGARNQPPGALAFEFGPVQSRSVLPDPDEMTREYLAQPEVFVMWRGDYNLLARNYDKALDYYTTALELNPSLDEAHYRIALIDLIRNEQQIALPATTEAQAASPGG